MFYDDVPVKVFHMVQIGYAVMTMQADPPDLVEDVVTAEQAGFDFSVTCDHCFPWPASQDRARPMPGLGTAAQATSRIPLMT
jgi:alkanesulfonate monooxygenase SsuD/methylene tetrahydromethanopterin reductase-like flavin-dependent oxidoreductase (luciferase family)